MSARERLPDRRLAVTEVVEFTPHNYLVSAGFDPVTGAKEGSAVAAILNDAAVVISVALQHGVPIESLAKSICRVYAAPPSARQLDPNQGPTPTKPASPIGAALDMLADLSADMAGAS